MYAMVKRGSLTVTQTRLSTADHRRKVMSLRATLNPIIDARQIAINRAVVETLRNPVVARAVARGLRLHELEKA